MSIVKLLHDLSMLADRQILVIALYSAQLLSALRKHLVINHEFSLFDIGQFSFPLQLSEQNETGIITELDRNRSIYPIGPDCAGRCNS